MIKLINGDCLVEMASIEDGSIDMILCDLPFQITNCHWDKLIPFEPLWAHYKRIIKPNGAIVLFGSQPFTSALVMSNPKMFKYECVYEKSRKVGFVNAKLKPLNAHENILVFSHGKTSNGNKNNMAYNPQGLIEMNKVVNGLKGVSSESDGNGYGRPSMKQNHIQTHTNYPSSILKYSNPVKPVHPTQKPVPLLEYLIKTYTNEGETVLDNCFGSCSTGVACINTNRSFIGIEMDKTYFDIGVERIKVAEARINAL